MATLRSAIQIYDGMSPALRSMHRVLSTVINSFEALQNDSAQAIDTSSMRAARTELAQIGSTFDLIEDEIEQARRRQEQFNQSVRGGESASASLLQKVKGLAGAYLGMQGASRAKDWAMGSLDLAGVQLDAERQLKNVLQNTGADAGAFDAIAVKASDIQGRTLYGDEAMIAGAGELSTYMNDAAAIQKMMDTLSNYAAGMSGGGAVDVRQMVEYGTQLGKVLVGSYDGITQKGFELTDVQKEIMKNGTDMEKALVLDDVISESWAGLAETMANTPQGRIIQMQNSIGDIREEVGQGLYPVVVRLVDMIEARTPQIRSAMLGFGKAIGTVALIAGTLLSGAVQVYDFISGNWSLIGPVVWGIVGALAAYKGVILASNVATAIGTGIKMAGTLAQYAYAFATRSTVAADTAATAAQWGWNTAMLANPITWVIILIVALIAVVYLVVAAINKVTGSSISATGVIAGSINVVIQFFKNLGLTVANIARGIWDAMNANASNIQAAFQNSISNVQIFFYDLLSTALRVIAGIASALNQLPFIEFDFSGITSAADDYAARAAALESGKVEYQSITDAFKDGFSTFDTWKDGWVSDAYSSGYDWGANLADSFKLDDIAGQWAMDDIVGGLQGSMDETAANTGAMKDSMNIAEEDLKYMRDLAEQEAINRFTTAEIRVEMTNHNTVSGGMNIDGMVEGFTEGVQEAVDSMAEGVHSA